MPLARLGFSHIGRGTIARGHDGHHRQFFPTQSNAPWRQASFVCSPRRTNSSGADQSAYVSEPNSNGQGELFLATFLNPPKMHAKWEKLLSSVPLVNFVDRKVAITSPELSDLPCNVLMHLTSGLLNIQQAKA